MIGALLTLAFYVGSLLVIAVIGCWLTDIVIFPPHKEDDA
jgi:hypothetical protein